MSCIPSFRTLLLIALTCVAKAFAAYTLVDNFSGPSFLSGFDFFAQPDPTHGFVRCGNPLQNCAKWGVSIMEPAILLSLAFLTLQNITDTLIKQMQPLRAFSLSRTTKYTWA